MSRELTAPEGAVHELLGVRQDPPAKVGPRAHGINLKVLNALEDRWINRGALLRYLHYSAEAADSDALRRVRDEIAEVTAPKG